MKVYLLWKTGDKNGAVMDVTKAVNDASSVASHIPDKVIINTIKDYMNADDVLVVESEEEMLELFSNAKIIYEDGRGSLH